jgi:hypothetical protein
MDIRGLIKYNRVEAGPYMQNCELLYAADEHLILPTSYFIIVFLTNYFTIGANPKIIRRLNPIHSHNESEGFTCLITVRWVYFLTVENFGHLRANLEFLIIRP